ncbi:MAG: BatA domain-containing protein [Gemmatimonadaceae bacterium]
MIAFLAPMWLLGALAAAVPLLIHLMRRRIGTQVEFPAVRYLARAEREHSRKLRLRNLLLMVLRVFAVLLVAAAAARPIARVGSGGHAPTSMAIVLDNSLSSSAIVNGHPVLDDLKARARDVALRAGAEDRLWLVTADGAVHGGSVGAVVQAVEHVDAFGGAGDVPRALARAGGLVRSGVLNEREIAIITDGQATTWRAPVALAAATVLVYRPKGDPPPNHAVIEASSAPSRWTPRGAVHARVLVADSATYRITLEGRTLARGSVAKDGEILVRATPPERGWVAGTVELEPDELRGDDVRHYSAWIGPAPAVAVAPAVGLFARSAVDALVQSDRVSLGSEVAFAPADEASKLPALLVAPLDPVRIGAADRALERLGVPWRLGAVRRTASVVRGERIDNATVSMRYALTPVAGAPRGDTLATAGGEPWIVSGPGFVLIASPLVPEATTLPVRAGFVPWLNDVISQRLSAEAGSVVTTVPGATLTRPAFADALEAAPGQKLAFAGDTLRAPDHAGSYFLLKGDKRVGALVVNAEGDESALARLSSDALAQRVRARRVRSLDDAPSWTALTFVSSPRRALVAPILMLAALLLIAESAVAGAGRRKQA